MANKLEFSAPNLAAQVQMPRYMVKDPLSDKEYCRWGDTNRFGEEMFQRFVACAPMASIINLDTDLVMGDSLVWSPRLYDFPKRINSWGDNLDEVVKKCAFDLDLYGGFSVFVERDEFNCVAEIQYLDFSLVRVNKHHTKAKVYTDQNYSTWNEYPIFSDNYDFTTSVFYFDGHSRVAYPIPRYYSAVTSIDAYIQSNLFNLNSVLRGFAPSYIINYGNAVDDPEERKQIYNDFRDKFCGAANSGMPLLVYNESQDTRATITPVPVSNQAPMYEAIRKAAFKDIIAAFRCPSCLLGLDGEGTSLFEDAEKINQATSLYVRQVIMPMQLSLRVSFGKIFNDPETLNFRKFSVPSVDTAQAATLTESKSETESTTESIVDENKNETIEKGGIQ